MVSTVSENCFYDEIPLILYNYRVSFDRKTLDTTSLDDARGK